MWPTVKQVISLVQADVFTAQDFGQFSFMGKGGSYLAPYHVWEDKLPEDVKWSSSAPQEIMDGTFWCRSTRARPVRVGVSESAIRAPATPPGCRGVLGRRFLPGPT